MSVDAPVYEHVLFAREGRLASVTMNRPQRRNALSLAHMLELLDCFERIGADKSIGTVILSGSGPAFCAGHDLSEMAGQAPEFYRHLFDVCTKLMETIQSIPQPVIAQIHGVATAAGCQLAATCDLVVAAEEARFA
ncbi:MAG: enoyl-CoA hydratase, partial [Oscillochloris sp.]|nr:enoyl-CoA hydratase [Oscillochloris sp.]